MMDFYIFIQDEDYPTDTVWTEENWEDVTPNWEDIDDNWEGS